jgi:acyl-CoA synthetase (NDP forming)
MLKGGVTEAGIRAVASHTGALAGSSEVWDSLLRQAGAIQVYSLEELVDMVVTFTHLPLPSGRKLGILGIGGGTTVLATDDCTNAGFEIPRFPTEIQDKLRSYLKKGGIGVG